MIRPLPWLLVLALLAPGSAFARPKAKAKDTAAPVITHVRVTESPTGRPILIRARIDDASEIFASSVYVRAQGSGEYVTISMQRVQDAFEATIPSEQVSGPLEYFIEAFDEEGNGPAHEGSPDAPLLIKMGGAVLEPPPIVVPPPPPSGGQVVAPPPPSAEDDDGGIATKWWFWTIVGVAVTGGIVGVVLATRPGDPQDFVDIEVRGPDPTMGL